MTRSHTPKTMVAIAAAGIIVFSTNKEKEPLEGVSGVFMNREHPSKPYAFFCEDIRTNKEEVIECLDNLVTLLDFSFKEPVYWSTPASFNKSMRDQLGNPCLELEQAFKKLYKLTKSSDNFLIVDKLCFSVYRKQGTVRFQFIDHPGRHTLHSSKSLIYTSWLFGKKDHRYFGMNKNLDKYPFIKFIWAEKWEDNFKPVSVAQYFEYKSKTKENATVTV